MTKCNHNFKYFYQKDSMDNTHLVIACEICDKLKSEKSFRPLREAEYVDYEIKWRITKAQKKRDEKLNKIGLF